MKVELVETNKESLMRCSQLCETPVYSMVELESQSECEKNFKIIVPIINPTHNYYLRIQEIHSSILAGSGMKIC